jgi:WD40 repeat protein
VAYSPDGRLLVSGGQDTTLKLWDADMGRHLRTLHGHTDMVNHVAFSPDGTRIVSAGYGDLTVRIWDVASGKTTMTLAGVENVNDGDYFAPQGNVPRPQENVEGVGFSPDGQRIAACVHGQENSVKLWDAETGELLRTIRTPVGPRWIAFNTDGTCIGTACLDGSCRVWNVETGEEDLILSGHAQRVTALAFNSDGQRVFSSSLDGTVKVWHAQSGEELLTLTGHRTGLWGLAISPDGRMIAAATSMNIVNLWKTHFPSDQTR